MKTKILILCALIIIQNTSAIATELTVKAQLEKLNAYWKGQTTDYPVLRETAQLTDEVTLIRTHLSLVEKVLRSKGIAHLTRKQIANRLKCLDLLHNYWVKGMFPKNLYHTSRTPYFIDKYGTTCAVGQLIVSTGFEEFAQKISREHNNAYIAELNAIYPEINKWANAFGLTIEELAWIQPCYCVTSGAATINPTCPGSYNGYFMPDISNLPPPCTFGSSRWNGTVWIPKLYNCAECDLNAGSYKMTVKDGQGQTHEFFATLTDPPPATINIVVSGDGSNCIATATVFAIGGFPPYSYVWPAVASTTNIAQGLCELTYRVLVSDSKPCTYEKIFVIGNPTSIKEFSYEGFKIFPNPVKDKLTFEFSNSTSGNLKLNINNTLGQLVYSKNNFDLKEELDVNFLKSGIYYLTLRPAQGESEKGQKIFKMIKE